MLFIRPRRIAQDERAALVMEGDAPLLPQPVQELPVAFPELSLVVALRILAAAKAGTGQAHLMQVRVSVQDRSGNLDHRAVLEDAAVTAERGQPQPRTQSQTVERATLVRAYALRLGHHGGQLAYARAKIRGPGTPRHTRNVRAASFDRNPDRHFLADELIDLDERLHGTDGQSGEFDGGQLHGVVVQAAKLLRTRQARDREERHVLPDRQGIAGDIKRAGLRVP